MSKRTARPGTGWSDISFLLQYGKFCLECSFYHFNFHPPTSIAHLFLGLQGFISKGYVPIFQLTQLTYIGLFGCVYDLFSVTGYFLEMYQSRQWSRLYKEVAKDAPKFDKCGWRNHIGYIEARVSFLCLVCQSLYHRVGLWSKYTEFALNSFTRSFANIGGPNVLYF